MFGLVAALAMSSGDLTLSGSLSHCCNIYNPRLEGNLSFCFLAAVPLELQHQVTCDFASIICCQFIIFCPSVFSCNRE
jgi:hypothetical protein